MEAVIGWTRNAVAVTLARPMPKSTAQVSFTTVREFGLKLPGTEEGTAYGSRALMVNRQWFACMAIHKSAEPNTLVVQIPLDQRDELLAAAAETYYVTDHYADYPMVLVRLSRIHRDALQDLLRMAHRYVAAKPPKRKRSGRPMRSS